MSLGLSVSSMCLSIDCFEVCKWLYIVNYSFLKIFSIYLIIIQLCIIQKVYSKKITDFQGDQLCPNRFIKKNPIFSSYRLCCAGKKGYNTFFKALKMRKEQVMPKLKKYRQGFKL